jgi:hypothetical protein
MAKESQSYRNLPFGCLVKLAALQGVTATVVATQIVCNDEIPNPQGTI